MCDCTGNPVKFVGKEKVQTETDYRSAYGLEFSRYYSSVKVGSHALMSRDGWTHTYSRRFIDSGEIPAGPTPISGYYRWIAGAGTVGMWVGQGSLLAFDQPQTVTISRADGYGYYFASSDGGQTYKADADVNAELAILERDGSGHGTRWQLRTPENDVEIYSQGLLESVRYANGRLHTLTYSGSDTDAMIAPRAGLLIGVVDDLGASLQFEYNADEQITRLLDPAGQAYVYSYGAVSKLLEQVTYPDGFRRRYHFDELAYATRIPGKPLLTGISIEATTDSFIRHAIFSYNASGWPISTEHAGGVNKYTFDYGNSKITDPIGTVRSYGSSNVNGRRTQDSINQPNGNGTTSSRLVRFDSAGNKSSEHDWRQIWTFFTVDPITNLETQRIEGFSTVTARTISTNWDTNLRKPLQIAEPKRLTTFSYDTFGNMLTRTIRATSDQTGSLGFSAPQVGQAQVWTYTYNTRSQILTEDGPRTDVSDITTYTYDIGGKLISVTNAAGQTTIYSEYDAHGRARRITDPNGLVTELSFTPRGQLASANVGGRVSVYAYNGAGQLISATLPEGPTLIYTYDPAQRLTGISDTSGNSVNYTLDLIGNRTSEQVRDGTGLLVRQVSRVFDVLGRVKQVTGAAL